MTACRNSGAESLEPAGVMSARETLKHISDELVCALCGDIFVDPRVLRCQHCFCLRCLFSQTLHDRGNHLTIKCAFRCEEATTTMGDIRTLPRNPIIASMARHVRMRRTEELRMRRDAIAAAGESLSPVASASPAPCGTGSTALATRQSREVDELLECEWCSVNSASCQLCPYCLSRVCAECRGQFGDHHFLCRAVHDERAARRGVETVSGGAVGRGAASRAEAVADGSAGRQQFPFFFAEEDVLPLLYDKVSAAVRSGNPASHAANSSDAASSDLDDTIVGLADVEVAVAHLARIASPSCTVQCTQNAIGFASVLRVQLPLRVGPLVLQLSDTHWRTDDAGAEALLFVTNLLHAAKRVVKDVNATSLEMGSLLEELSSIARRDLVERDRGLQLFAFRVATTARVQVLVARNGVLAHLVRARLVAEVMGDMVADRFAQLFTHSHASERHELRQRRESFLRTHMLLCDHMDKAMNGLDAVCVGVELIVSEVFRRIARMLSDLDGSRATPRVPAAWSLHSITEPATAQRRHEGAAAPVRCPALRSTRTTTAAAAAHAPAPDPIDGTAAGRPFAGLLHNRRVTLHAVTRRMTSTLADFATVRQATWVHINTTIRACGLTTEDRDAILRMEEAIQLATDECLKQMGKLSRAMHTWETFAACCDEAEMDMFASSLAKVYTVLLFPPSRDEHAARAPASAPEQDRVASPRVHTDHSNASQEAEDAATASGSHAAGVSTPPPRSHRSRRHRASDGEASGTQQDYFPFRYTREEVCGELEKLRLLRSCLLNVELRTLWGTLRGYETQTDVLDYMTALMKTEQSHHLLLLRAAASAEEMGVASLAHYGASLTLFEPMIQTVLLRRDEAIAQAHRMLQMTPPEDVLRELDETQDDSCSEMESDEQGSIVLVRDYYRRDVALSACATLGLRLVNEAHGVAPPDRESGPLSAPLGLPIEGLAAFSEPEGATTSATSPPNPTASLQTDESMAEEPPQQVAATSGGTAGDVGETVEPASAQSDGDEAESRHSPMREDADPSVLNDAPSAMAAGSHDVANVNTADDRLDQQEASPATAPDPAEPLWRALHRRGTAAERIFPTDDGKRCVLRVGASVTGDDRDGRSRAMSLFTKSFRVPCDHAVAQSTEDLPLPLIVGTYRYKKGEPRVFVVDAQTGDAWVEHPESTSGGEAYSLLSVFGRKQLLVFVLVNLAARYLWGSSMKAALST